MAIMRNQQGADLSAPAPVAVQQSSATGQGATRDTRIDAFPMQSLNNIMDTATKLASRHFSAEMDQEYLEGQIDAMTGRAQDDANESWWQADPRNAGFADAKGQMAVSQGVAEMQAKMKQYAQMSPDEFGKVMKQQMIDISTNQGPMTATGRQAATNLAMTSMQSLTQQHAAEHARYQIDQYAQAVNATGNVVATGLATAKASGSADAYTAATQNYMLWNAQTLQDPNLPDDVKNTQIVSNAMQVLEAGQTLPVETMLNSAVGLRIPAGARAQIMAKLKSVKEGNAYDDNIGLVQQYAQLKAQQEQGIPVDPNQMNSVISRMHTAKLLSDGAAMSAQSDLYAQQFKQERMNTAVNALRTGNRSALIQSGVSEEDALDNIEKKLYQQGANPVDVFNQMAMIGVSGSPAALKRAGAQLNASLSVFGSGAELNPQAVQTLQGITGNLDNLSRTNPALYSTVLSGLSPDAQDKLTYLRDQTRGGLSVEQAAAGYADYKAKNASASPEERAAIMTQRKGDVDAAVKKAADPGFLSKAWSFFTSDGKTGAMAADTVGVVQQAVRQEAEAILHNNPNISADALSDRAISNVQNRSINVGGSILIAPQGSSVRQALGVPATTSDADLQTALQNLAASNAPGNGTGLTPHYTMHGSSISVQYQDKDGLNVAAPVIITPGAVGAAVGDVQQKRLDAATYAYGSGAPMTVKDRATGKMVNFRVNGQNSAGVDNSIMLAARQELIGHEGYSSQVWSNNGTVLDGFSVRIDNPSHSGRQSIGRENGLERNLQDFNDETDRLAQAAVGQRAALHWAVNGWEDQNPAQFKFLMDMNYHAGAGWMKNNAELVTAIQNKDIGAATTALANTAAYKQAGEDRQKYMVRNLVEGMQ